MGIMPDRMQEWAGIVGSGLETARWRAAVYLLLYLLCAVAFHGMTDNHLFNDDFTWLDAARYSMEGGSVLTTRVVGFFRPLVNVSFRSMEWLSPGNIPLHYVFNLLLHFICTVLVFHLFSRLAGNAWTALAGASLFAVTSVHSGAILWISARTTLISSALLLGSILMLISGGRVRRTAVAGLLFALALTAKETAIAGLLIALLLYLLPIPARPSRAGMIVFGIISLLYLTARALVMGGFVQPNWGPGLHVVRNLGGGFLYQFHPWPLLTLFWPQGTHIPESTHPLLPEIAAFPLAILLIWIGSRTRERPLYILGTGWALLSLLPSSFFRYRFFSTVSITQNRYYYLSSVGTVFAIVLLLGLLYRYRGRIGRYAAIILFILFTAGYLVRTDRLEKRWDEFTMMYHEIVRTLIEGADEFPGTDLVLVEDPPMAYRYLIRAVHLERPEILLVEIGSRERAVLFRPCLYVTYSGDVPKKMRMERLE
jgi:hypothetical protein